MTEKQVDRRVRRTKKQLRQGLTQLLQEKPVKNITVREIAELVDINRGTFYLHYKDVFDMVEQIENELFRDFENLLDAHSLAELQRTPLAILSDIFTFLSDNADMGIALLGPNGDPAFVDKLKNLVKEKCLHNWMQIYNTDKAVYFEYFYAFIVSGCIGLIQIWLKSGMKESPEQMAQLAETMIVQGVQVLE